MKTITLDDLRRWGACYDDEKLREMARGRTEISPLALARMRSIPVEDRIWVLLRPEVLGDEIQPLLESWAERAIRRSLGKSDCPEWEEWAKKWISGEDRSAAAALAAAEAAAEAAAWAARAAAEAARAAAEAAAEAAAWDAERKAQLRDIKRVLKRRGAC